MSTNYYTEAPKGYEEKELHIGKSSGGWYFSLHVIPELGITTWDAWRDYLKGKKIRDEYDNCITFEELKKVVTDRGEFDASAVIKIQGHAMLYGDTPEEFLRQNYAELAEHGLVRCIIGGHCVGHGEGTWDYIEGEFS